MSFRSLLNTAVVIYRPTETSDNSFGEPTITNSLVGSEYWAIQTLAADEDELAFGVANRDIFRGFASEDSEVKEYDLVFVGTDEYEVVSVQDAAGRGHHLEVELRRRGAQVQ